MSRVSRFCTAWCERGASQMAWAGRGAALQLLFRRSIVTGIVFVCHNMASQSNEAFFGRGGCSRRTASRGHRPVSVEIYGQGHTTQVDAWRAFADDVAKLGVDSDRRSRRSSVGDRSNATGASGGSSTVTVTGRDHVVCAARAELKNARQYRILRNLHLEYKIEAHIQPRF